MNESLHISNARIWTGDLQLPQASSITISSGQIEALNRPGGNKNIPVLDAEGMFAIPGMIDAHVHLLHGGAYLEQLDLSSISSRKEFEAAIENQHASLPAGQWLLAGGWQDSHIQGLQKPDKTWLAGAGDRPVVCYRMDLHAALVNDAVLDICDLDRDLAGGYVERDPETGEPSGLMVEAAAWELVNPLIPRPDVSTRLRHLINAQQQTGRFGLTTVGAMEYARDVSEVFEPVRDELSLRCRITLLDRRWPLDFGYSRSFINDDSLAVIGYKAFLDGSFGSHTARMLQPYNDAPDDCGLWVELAEQGCLHEWAQAVAAEGLSPSMHAIGDAACRLALDVIDQLPASSHPRIEHAQHIAVQDIPRFENRIASMQPLHKADDGVYAEKRLGYERLAGAYAFQSLMQAGANLALGSDWPVVSCDPMLGIQAAVTGKLRNGQVFLPEQNLTVEQALRGYTSGSAYALGMDRAGILSPGYMGDVVLLDADPFTTDWMQTIPRVLMTIVGGRIVYDAR